MFSKECLVLILILYLSTIFYIVLLYFSAIQTTALTLEHFYYFVITKTKPLLGPLGSGALVVSAYGIVLLHVVVYVVTLHIKRLLM